MRQNSFRHFAGFVNLNPSRETNSLPTVSDTPSFVAHLVDSPAGMEPGEGRAQLTQVRCQNFQIIVKQGAAYHETSVNVEVLARVLMRPKPGVDRPIFARDLYDAVLFDMDGVITNTANLHASCWKIMFDEFLQTWATRNAEPFREFDIGADYRLYVDGKPRYQGVSDFLKSRGIALPEGSPEDLPSAETVCGLGNRKNELIKEQLLRTGVESYPGTIAFVLYLRRIGIRTAVVTSSENCQTILKAAKIEDLFDARVDGQVLVEQRVAGKPAPDSFLKAAEMLRVPPQRAIVVEDAIAGVQAGAQGGFGLVIGVARKDNAEELKSQGADIVVHDLAELFSGFPAHLLETAA